MKTKAAVITLLIGIPAFLLGPNAPLGHFVWPAPAHLMPEPTSTQALLFVLLGLLEAVALGLAVAFVTFGWPLVKQVKAPYRGRAVVAFCSTAWLLGNWWLHDNLHMVAGMNPQGLLWIDYIFHGSLILAAAALAACGVSLLVERPLALAVSQTR